MNKKIYIFSGLDNSGKDTAIGVLSDLLYNRHKDDNVYSSILNVHCLRPVYGSGKEQEADTDLSGYFSQYKESLIAQLSTLFNNNIDYIIFNRFYLEEFVYGQLYRDRSESACKGLITATINLIINWLIENWEITGIMDKEAGMKWIEDNILYIKTDCPTEFLIQNDDGLSQSFNDADEIDKEQELFNNYIDILKNTYNIHTVKLKTAKPDPNGNGFIWANKEAELKVAFTFIV